MESELRRDGLLWLALTELASQDCKKRVEATECQQKREKRGVDGKVETPPCGGV